MEISVPAGIGAIRNLLERSFKACAAGHIIKKRGNRDLQGPDFPAFN